MGSPGLGGVLAGPPAKIGIRLRLWNNKRRSYPWLHSYRATHALAAETAETLQGGFVQREQEGQERGEAEKGKEVEEERSGRKCGENEKN